MKGAYSHSYESSLQVYGVRMKGAYSRESNEPRPLGGVREGAYSGQQYGLDEKKV